MVVTGTGTLLITGVVGQPVANGFMCTTCHDDSRKLPGPLRRDDRALPQRRQADLQHREGCRRQPDPGRLQPVHRVPPGPRVHGHREQVPGGQGSRHGRSTRSASRTSTTSPPAPRSSVTPPRAPTSTKARRTSATTEHPLNQCTDCHDVHAAGRQGRRCARPATPPSRPKKTCRLSACRRRTTTGTAMRPKASTARSTPCARASVRGRPGYAKKNGTPIVYDAAAYPYFFVDARRGWQGRRGRQGRRDALQRLDAHAAARPASTYQYCLQGPGCLHAQPEVRHAVPVRLDRQPGQGRGRWHDARRSPDRRSRTRNEGTGHARARSSCSAGASPSPPQPFRNSATPRPVHGHRCRRPSR